MTIKAQLIKDSVSTADIRISTFVLTYPRFIHSEFMTHRLFSKNSASSRAIPIKKMIEAVKTDPAMPLRWGKNQKGMQAGESLTEGEKDKARTEWLSGRDEAIKTAEKLESLGLHKQIVNRVLEPYMHMTVVCTGTEDAYANFLALRAHPAAQPEIQALAWMVQLELKKAKPQTLMPGEWHLPFTDGLYSKNDVENFGVKLVSSVAACARVSYTNHGKEANPNDDYNLFCRLLHNKPMHASPAEHQAMATGQSDLKSGNFTGWIQYRKTLDGERQNHLKTELIKEHKVL